jgi:hypothetical protein
MGKIDGGARAIRGDADRNLAVFSHDQGLRTTHTLISRHARPKGRV